MVARPLSVSMHKLYSAFTSANYEYYPIGSEPSSLESSPKSSPKVPLRDPPASRGGSRSPERKCDDEGSPMRGTTPEAAQCGGGQPGGCKPEPSSGGNPSSTHGNGYGYAGTSAGAGGGCGGSGGNGGGGGGSFGRPGPSGVGPEGGECAGVRWYCVTRGRAVGVFTGW